MYYKIEKYDKAIECFNISSQINPNNPVLITFMAMSHAAKRQYQEALNYFLQSERLEPKNGLNRY